MDDSHFVLAKVADSLFLLFFTEKMCQKSKAHVGPACFMNFTTFGGEIKWPQIFVGQAEASAALRSQDF